MFILYFMREILYNFITHVYEFRKLIIRKFIRPFRT